MALNSEAKPATQVSVEEVCVNGHVDNKSWFGEEDDNNTREVERRKCSTLRAAKDEP